MRSDTSFEQIDLKITLTVCEQIQRSVHNY